MNVEHVLKTLNDHAVDYLLIGGMNFLLNHQPVVTFDIDFFVQDEDANLQALNRALKVLAAEWGPNENEWKAVPDDHRWLQRQGVLCMTSPYGAIDVFRAVRGLENDYNGCKQRAALKKLGPLEYRSLSDEDMLRCQLALDATDRKLERVRVLEAAIKNRLKP